MSSRGDAARAHWLETLERFCENRDASGSEKYWAPRLDTLPQDQIRAIQDAKVAAVVPHLYENSPFYRRRFDRLGIIPSDIRTVDDLIAKWPVLDKHEMMEDALAHPPYGTYTAMTDEVWADRGWMLYASGGSTGTPRVFRYSHIDREYNAWANARGLHSMDFRKGDTVFMVSGYGPHVWAWGVQYALEKMRLPTLVGGGMDAKARALTVMRYNPTILLATPSYALYLARVIQDMGGDPKTTAIRTLFVAGEPAFSIKATRERLQDVWGARVVEFYGCTEASPHVGGFSCDASQPADGPVSTHLLEDIQVWEVVDPDTMAPLPDGQRGLTVCTSLNSESSPQLRFLVGDYTVFDRTPCACGRTHVRAIGSFTGRSDDLINLRGIKMFPVQIEDAVRRVPGVGDEYEVVLDTNADGLDTMLLRVEHAEGTPVADKVRDEIRARCEVRVEVEVLEPGTLPKTEFKSKRIRDQRNKTAG